MLQFPRSLDFLYAACIIQRTLKPESTVVTRGGQANGQLPVAPWAWAGVAVSLQRCFGESFYSVETMLKLTSWAKSLT